MKIAIDAQLLVRTVAASAQPYYFMQVAAGAADSALEKALIDLIEGLRKSYQIDLLIVCDGLSPKFISEKEMTPVQKAAALWAKASAETCGKEVLQNEILSCFRNAYRQEVLSAARKTGTDFMVAPYASAPQLVYLYLRQIVNCCAGSLMCLLYNVAEAPDDEDSEERVQADPLTQVITGINLLTGTFDWIDKEDMMAVVDKQAEGSLDEDTLAQVFAALGALYGVSLLEDNNLETRRSLFMRALKNGGSTSELHQKPEDAQTILLINLIFQIAPVLNDSSSWTA
jgi:hypothetical protein